MASSIHYCARCGGGFKVVASDEVPLYDAVCAAEVAAAEVVAAEVALAEALAAALAAQPAAGPPASRRAGRV